MWKVPIWVLTKGQEIPSIGLWIFPVLKAKLSLEDIEGFSQRPLSFLVPLPSPFLRGDRCIKLRWPDAINIPFYHIPSFWFHTHQATFSLWSGFPCRSAYKGKMYCSYKLWFNCYLMNWWSLIMIWFPILIYYSEKKWACHVLF